MILLEVTESVLSVLLCSALHEFSLSNLYNNKKLSKQYYSARVYDGLGETSNPSELNRTRCLLSTMLPSSSTETMFCYLNLTSYFGPSSATHTYIMDWAGRSRVLSYLS